MNTPLGIKKPPLHVKENIASKSGMDARHQKKMAAKYDKDLENRVVKWISDVTGEEVVDFPENLKDGIILIKLINAIKPGSVSKYTKKPRVRFQQIENVGLFLKGLRKIGMDESEVFDTGDLINDRSKNQVLLCLDAVARKAKSISGFKGPYMKGVIAEKKGTKKNWTEGEIRKQGGVGTLMERKQLEVSKSANVGPKDYGLKHVTRHGHTKS